MNTVEQLPFVSVKKKTIQLLLDYCLEHKIEFTVAPKNSEEYKVTFNLKDYHNAIALGICLRELKIEFGQSAESVAAIKAKKATPVSKEVASEKTALTEPLLMPENSLSFDLDAMH